MVEDVAKLSAEGDSGRREISAEDYHRLHPKLVARFRREGAAAEEVSDLINETFLRAHRSLDNFEARSELDTWVISIAKAVWLQHRRGRRRLKRDAPEIALEAATFEIPDRRKNPEEEVIDSNQLAWARRAIQRLPEAMREALCLYLDGRKYREIARQMNVSESRVASLIHQAKQKLHREAAEQSSI